MIRRGPDIALRPFVPSDFTALHAIVSHWEVTRQLGVWPWPADPAFTRVRCVLRSNAFGWAIWFRGRYVGFVAGRGHSFGYLLSPDAAGQGISTAAARAWVDTYFRTQAAALDVSVWHDNPASRAVLLKLGFRERKREIIHAIPRGVQTEVLRFRLTRHMWRKVRQPQQRPSRYRP